MEDIAFKQPKRHMLKIATHNSMTGEKSLWFSIPGIPFARTQTKPIYEQYLCGCRLFDLRTKFIRGKWRGAHGFWYSKTGIEDALVFLNLMSREGDPVYVSLTYEGRLKNADAFTRQAVEWKKKYGSLCWGPISAKYKDSHSLVVEYGGIVEPDPGFEGGVQAFLPLDGKHWQTILPIPWLWKKFYFKEVEFNEDYFQFVDFL